MLRWVRFAYERVPLAPAGFPCLGCGLPTREVRTRDAGFCPACRTETATVDVFLAGFGRLH